MNKALKQNKFAQYTPNGKAGRHSGFRQILLDKEFVLRPVLTIKYSGKMSDRHTIQLSPRTGDLLFKYTWFKDGNYRYDVSRFNGATYTELPFQRIETVNLWHKLWETHPWASKFIENDEHGPSYLPRNVFGNTLVEKTKGRRLTTFITNYGISDMLRPVGCSVSAFFRELMVSPMDGLKLEPVPCPDLSAYVPKYTTVTDVDKDTSVREYWYSWNGDSISNISLHYDECHSCIETADDTGAGSVIVIPPDATVLIKVVRTTISYHEFYGGATLTIDTYTV